MTRLLHTGIQRFFGSSPALLWREDFRYQHLLILCYHSVVSSDHSVQRFQYENSVSTTEFRWQLEELGQHFEFITIDEAVSARSDRRQKPAVLITFDDGYRNNLQLAAPELQRVGAPAAFFLSTSYIGENSLLWPLEMENRLCQSAGAQIPDPAQEGAFIPVPASKTDLPPLAFRLRQTLKALPDPARLSYLEAFRNSTALDPSHVDHELNDFLNWDEVRQLAAKGFAIGSHTRTHPILSRLDSDALRSELAGSREELERQLGAPVHFLAYPNGGTADYSPQVKEAAREAGYRSAFAVGDQFNKPGGDNFAIQRQIIFGHLPKYYFRYVVSGWRDALNAFRSA